MLHKVAVVVFKLHVLVQRAFRAVGFIAPVYAARIVARNLDCRSSLSLLTILVVGVG